jgi:hypothetical protein
MNFTPFFAFALLALSNAPAQSQPATRQIGRVEDKRLGEISGLSASRRFRGWVWAHNDSGDGPRLFLLEKGKTRAVVTLAGAAALDWEDMAVAGSGLNAWVYVADCGDNLRWRSTITVYRFRERDLALKTATRAVQNISIRPQVMHLQLPDGAEDAEALAVNARGEMLLVSKSAGPSSFYLADWRASKSESEVRTMKKVAELHFDAGSKRRRVRESLATAASLSLDESRLAISTYASLHVWKLGRGPWRSLDWARVLQSPQVIALPKLKQCESIAWVSSTQVLVTSEGENQALHLISIR